MQFLENINTTMILFMGIVCVLIGVLSYIFYKKYLEITSLIDSKDMKIKQLLDERVFHMKENLHMSEEMAKYCEKLSSRDTKIDDENVEDDTVSEVVAGDLAFGMLKSIPEEDEDEIVAMADDIFKDIPDVVEGTTPEEELEFKLEKEMDVMVNEVIDTPIEVMPELVEDLPEYTEDSVDIVEELPEIVELTLGGVVLVAEEKPKKKRGRKKKVKTIVVE